MLPRVLIVASACVLAGIVLAVSLMWPAPPTSTHADGRQRVQPQDIRPLDPGTPGADGQIEAENVRIVLYRESGPTIIFDAASIDPRSQGVMEAQAPITRIYLRNNRVVEIRARAGTLDAPDNQPRKGWFRDDVILTMFEAEGDRPLDLSPTSRDKQLRVLLDDAEFDVDMGTITTDGPVRLLGRGVEFQGRGLDMAYNEANRRLDELVIRRGNYVRFRAAAAPADAGEAPPAAQPDDGEADAVAVEPLQVYRAELLRDVRVDSSQMHIDADRLRVFFAVSQSASEAQLLGSDDATSSDGDTPTGDRPAHASHADPLVMQPSDDDVVVRWSGRLVVEPVLDDSAPPLRSQDDALLELSGQPVTIETVDGETIKAAFVEYHIRAGDMRLLGSDMQPLVLDSPAMGGQMRGQRLDFDRGAGTGRFVGAGSLRAYDKPGALDRMEPQRQLRTDDGRLPPGFAVTWADSLDLAFFNPDRQRAARSGGVPTMSLRSATFRGDVRTNHPMFTLGAQALALAFSEPGSDAAPVHTIEATGAVRVAAQGQTPEDALDVSSERLTIELVRDATGQVQPDRFIARRNVVVHQPAWRINADELDVTFDSGKPLAEQVNDAAAAQTVRRDDSAPTRLIEDPLAFLRPAESLPMTQPRVSIEQLLTLGVDEAEAQPPTDGPIDPSVFDVSLDLSFVPERRLINRGTRPAVMPLGVPFDDDPLAGRIRILEAVNARAPADEQDGTSDPRKLRMAHMEARGSVRVDLQDQQTTVMADHLVARELTLVELFGTADTPARLVREGGELTGDHIILEQTSETVFVEGPGELHFTSKPADDDADPADTSRVDVSWTRSMRFDNHHRTARVLGGVIAQTRQGRDATVLRCDDLEMRFHSLGEITRVMPASDAERRALGEQEAIIDRLQRGGWTLDTMVARGDKAVFEAASFKADGDKPDTRVTLRGPVMTFDNATEQLQIAGQGAMLIEDFREGGDAARPDANQPLPMVRMAGRGRTLFHWDEDCTFNAANNDMIINGAVQMVHVGQDGQDPVKLDCLRFRADLEPTGGLAGWFSRKPPQPHIIGVYADGRVRLKGQGRTINTDHAHYTARNQRVRLDADDGRMTELINEADPTRPVRSQSFIWDLRTDRIELIRPGVQQMPVGRD